MAYRIAVASSDGVHVDRHFGGAEEFSIYAVDDGGSFSFLERRAAPAGTSGGDAADCAGQGGGCEASPCGNSGGGCAAGACGSGGGASVKVQLIADCRAVVCARIGFNVQKQLERKAIASFDVECPVDEALEKIAKYFFSMDNHIRFGKA